MSGISAAMVKELREKTGAGMMDCKAALTSCDGDMSKANDFLRKKGLATAQKRAGRALSEGTIQSYIHMGGKIGVMVEVNCESDFVAKNEAFQEFARNIADAYRGHQPGGDHTGGRFRRDGRQGDGDLRAQAKETGKPENMLEKIAEGKLQKFYKESCLMNQAYVRNPEITVADLLNEQIAKIGENITIKRFCRFQLGES